MIKILLWLLMCFSIIGYAGTPRHVVVGGLSSGNALDSTSGWSAQYALKNNPVVRPGDTIYFHEGSYRTDYDANAVGTATNPIIYRNWKNQRVTFYSPVSGGIADPPLIIKGKHLWFWGFELWIPDSTGGPWYGGGLATITGDSCKIINCIMHDALDVAIRDQSNANGTEIVGNIVYYSGRQSLRDNQGGYAAYVQNTQAAPKKLWRENIYWGQWGTGAQVYGTDAAAIKNISWIGNVSFNNGNLRGHETNFTGAEKYMPQLIFGNTEITGDIRNDTIMYNMSFCSISPGMYHYFNVGYHGGASSSIRLDSNIIVGDDISLYLEAGATGFSVNGNIIVGNYVPGTLSTTFRNNRYFVSRASGWSDTVIIRKNPYEPKRANVIIYNLDGTQTISFTPSTVLSVGDTYRIVSSTDFYGPVLATGIWTGGPITINMSTITLARHIRDPIPGHITYEPRNAAPYFAALLLTGSVEESAIPIDIGDPFDTNTRKVCPATAVSSY